MDSGGFEESDASVFFAYIKNLDPPLQSAFANFTRYSVKLT